MATHTEFLRSAQISARAEICANKIPNQNSNPNSKSSSVPASLVPSKTTSLIGKVAFYPIDPFGVAQDHPESN